MKSLILTISVTIAIIAVSCSSTYNTTGYSYVDDIYYNPQDQEQVANQKQLYSRSPVLDKEVEKEYDDDFNKMVEKYNQTKKSESVENRDFSAIQNEYANLLTNDSIQEVDTLVYYDDESGYWVNGFNGSSYDRSYAERLIRFHGPFDGIPYYSPFYNEIVYMNNWDWNVYLDGNYAYAFPTYSNPWYDSYYYPSSHFSFGFGWGYPHWRHGGYYNYWGGYYGGFYDPWYDPYYAYNWGYGYYPYYHNSHYGGGGYYSSGGGYNTVHSPVFKRSSADRSSSTSQSVPRGTRDRAGNSATNARSSSSPVNSMRGATRSSINSPNLKTSTRSSATKYQRTTRRSYTPTYTREQYSRNSSYNRTSTPSNYQNKSGSNSRQSSYTRTSRSTATRTYQPKASSSYKSTSTTKQSTPTTYKSRSSSSNNSYRRSSSSSNNNPSSSYRSSSPSPSRSSSYSGGGGSSRSSGSSSGGSSRSSSGSGGGSSRGSRR